MSCVNPIVETAMSLEAPVPFKTTLSGIVVLALRKGAPCLSTKFIDNMPSVSCPNTTKGKAKKANRQSVNAETKLFFISQFIL